MRIARAAWVGVALVLAGWLVAVLGFGVGDSGQTLVADSLRVGVRVFGLMLIMTGACLTVFANIGGPTLVMVFGIAVNLAHQAGLIANASLGILGAGLILLGALWGSRLIRQLPPPA